MTGGVRVHVLRTSDVPVLAIGEWRAEVHRRIDAGARPITLFGTALNDAADVTLTAVLEHQQTREWFLTRTHVARDAGYHALSELLPALSVFEREIHEAFDVRVAGHPWLKAVRGTEHGHASPEAMKAYRYLPIDGKEVHEVAVGPIHAGVIEPGSFRFMCLGETVHHLEVQLGYQHRGVEALLLRGEATRLAPLVETIAGDTSVAHTWAYCGAVEALAAVTVPLPTDAARGVLLELERVGMHLAGLAGLSTDLGFLQGATSYGRLRTTAINASMLLCGSRFGRGALLPGRNRARISKENIEKVQAALVLLQQDLDIINDCFVSSRTVQHRLRGVGILTRSAAEELGVVGMIARSCGIPLDQRSGAAGVYAAFPIDPSVEEGGDCWARACLRIAELKVSLAWLMKVTTALEPSVAALPLPSLAPSSLVVSTAEGWRGEVVHCLETDADGRLSRYRVQDPSLRNWMGLAIALRENEISDFPICNKSFDLSYCGNDL